MNYRQALAYLYALSPRGIELGLERMKRALSLRGNPERACPSVLVAGTNGKGSVATMMASVMAASGRRVGLYTSPHLHRLVERYRIDGRPIAERKLAQHVAQVRPFLEAEGTPSLSFFEVATLLAFEIFRDERCDLMVLEVGLGGRLDATNVVTPVCSVITSIGLDHTDRLGPTFATIAREKAGIIKPRVPVVCGAREPSAARVVRVRARAARAPLLAIDRDFAASAGHRRAQVRVLDTSYANLPRALAGEHQRDNLAVSVAALAAMRPRFPFDQRALRRGLARARWPGRLELLAGEPPILLDAAHNPEACAVLAQHLSTVAARYSRLVLVFGCMRDKDHATMLGLLAPHFSRLVFTSVDLPRAESPALLASRYGGEVASSPARALSRARKVAGRRGLVVACGSIFVMAALRALVLGVRADPPIAL